MAKKSLRRSFRYDKDQLGCMWGFISIFDLRHGRFTQKMLSDRRRTGKLAAGVGNPINKLDMLTWIDDNGGTFDGEESRSRAADADIRSVKKLLEDEMINGQDNKKEINNAEDSHLKQGRPTKHASKRMRNTKKHSSDNIYNLDAPESYKAKQPSHQKPEHQSKINLDIDKVMEEFCHGIHQKSTSYKNNEQRGELEGQTNGENPDFEDKLRKVIKLLISQKLNKGNQISEDGEIHPSKELMDALQILGSDGEMFVKQLQDPNSLLVKCIRNLPDPQLDRDEDSMSLAGSTLSEQELGSLGQSDELVNHEQRRFFRRKVKSQERSPSNGENISQASNRIVIVKPVSTGSEDPEAESIVGSSPESHYVLGNKELSERIGSHFFLTEIKRKLKYAMGKEHHRIPKGVSYYECQNLGDKGIRENVGINSPTKNQFLIEKIARPVVAMKKPNKTGKLKDSELGTEQRSADLPMQRVNNIYIEAKKHLSERLSSGEEKLDSSSGHFTKTLGKILSLPEYNSSPVGSPGRNLDHGLVTAQMSFLDSDKYLNVNENSSSLNQDAPVSLKCQTTKGLESQSGTSDDTSNNKVESSTFNSSAVVEQIHDTEVKRTSFFGEEVHSKGDVDIIKANEILVEDERNVLDAPCQPYSDYSIKDEDSNSDESEKCTVRQPCRLTTEDLDSPGDNPLPSSPLASTSNSLVTKKVEDRETAIDILERSSPISVLEPLYTEDDFSPASSRSLACHGLVQPRQIQFEEHGSAAADQSIHVKSSMEVRESIFEYVKAVVQTSDLNWNDELSMKSLFTDQLLDPSLFDEIELLPSQLCYEQNLLFDLVNEVLREICGHYFGCSPWVSFVKPYIRPVPDKKNILREVWEGVQWHLIPLPLPHTLGQTVRKDMAKTGTWMDLRFDTDIVCIEMGDDILDDLMEDTLLSCVKEYVLCFQEKKHSESSTNSENGCSL